MSAHGCAGLAAEERLEVPFVDRDPELTHAAVLESALRADENHRLVPAVCVTVVLLLTALTQLEGAKERPRGRPKELQDTLRFREICDQQLSR